MNRISATLDRSGLWRAQTPQGFRFADIPAAHEAAHAAGKGDMTITGDTPEQVDIDLHFEKPFAARNRIELVLTPAGEASTSVEWRMHGELSGFMRLFSIVKSMDSLVGADFEKGLARLKRVAESG